MTPINAVHAFVASYLRIGVNLLIAAAAITLVYISYQFEVSAYTVLLGPVLAGPKFATWKLTGAECLALGLNAAKVGLIFIIAHLVASRLGGVLRLKALRGLVLLLSLLMTLLVFAGQTISPHAERRLAALRQEAADRIETALGSVNYAFDTRRARVEKTLDAEFKALKAAHEVRLENHEKQLTKERGIGGQNFRGARYEELLRLIDEEKTDYRTQVRRLRDEARADIAKIERDRQDALAAARKASGNGRTDITLEDVFGTTEAQHPIVLRMVELVRTISDQDWITPAMVTVLLTFLVSLVIEVLPIALLGHVFSLFAVSAAVSQAGSAPVVAELATSPSRTSAKTNERNAVDPDINAFASAPGRYDIAAE